MELTSAILLREKLMDRGGDLAVRQNHDNTYGVEIRMELPGMVCETSSRKQAEKWIQTLREVEAPEYEFAESATFAARTSAHVSEFTINDPQLLEWFELLNLAAVGTRFDYRIYDCGRGKSMLIRRIWKLDEGKVVGEAVFFNAKMLREENVQMARGLIR